MLSEATKARFDRELAKYPADQRQSAVMACLAIVQQEQGWVSPEAEQAVAESQKKTKSRQELGRNERFEQISPEVGQLDEEALEDAMKDDPDETLALLERLGRRKHVSLELGIQSFEDATLEWLDRGHDGRCSIEALERLRRLAPSVHVCAHLIFGSPTDSPGMPEQAARILNESGVKGVKLHQLMVLQHTELARRWKEEGPFPVLSLEDYSARVGRFLEYLDPGIYIERLNALSSHAEECIAPEWSRYRWEPHNFMRQYFAQNGIRQGSRLS